MHIFRASKKKKSMHCATYASARAQGIAQSTSCASAPIRLQGIEWLAGIPTPLELGRCYPVWLWCSHATHVSPIHNLEGVCMLSKAPACLFVTESCCCLIFWKLSSSGAAEGGLTYFWVGVLENHTCPANAQFKALKNSSIMISFHVLHSFNTLAPTQNWQYLDGKVF